MRQTRGKIQSLLRVMRLVLALVVVVALVVVSGGYFYLRRSLPQTIGVVQLAGLSAPIDIVRDGNGVPHIFARQKLDAYFGLGYAHAQDRLWQMEFQRRISQGRLAEVLGPDLVSLDRFTRTLGMHRAAQSAWRSLPTEARTITEAYTAGINAFLAGKSGSELPPEFTMLSLTPAPWTGEDVLSWFKMITYDLSGNYETELLRSDIAAVVGQQNVEQLFAAASADGPSIVHSTGNTAGYHQLAELSAQVRRLIGSPIHGMEGLGSNSWVIDGTKSASGKPLLANDPHLGTSLPSIWYMAHLSAGDFDVSGATFPGIPGVAIGRNRSIAWGMTNLNPDVQDLYRERIDPSGQFVEIANQQQPIQVINETLKVKGAPDIALQVRITPHGPLISDVINANNAELPPEDQLQPFEPIALRWTALEPDDPTLQAFFDISVSQSWDDFKQALRNFAGPAQNFVYADVAGNIGYIGAGRIPIRRQVSGLVPAEGWSGAHEWSGWVPFDELPTSFNPPEHFIVTANNRPVGSDYPYFLGSEWSPSFRAKRIVELLSQEKRFTAQDFTAIQLDTFSSFAQVFLPLLEAQITPATDRERQALTTLQQWNYDAQSNSAATAIFHTWYAKLPRALLEDSLPEYMLADYEARFTFVSHFLIDVFSDHASQWCDTTNTPQPESCAQVAQQTFTAAIEELQTKLGDNMQQWRWSDLHYARFAHLPFDNLPALAYFFSRSVPTGGDTSTVNVGTYSLQRPFVQIAGATYRQISDLSSLTNDQFIVAIGQSGHPLSARYTDYVDDWRTGRYRSIGLLDPAGLRDQAKLTLEPCTTCPEATGGARSP